MSREVKTRTVLRQAPADGSLRLHSRRQERAVPRFVAACSEKMAVHALRDEGSAQSEIMQGRGALVTSRQ